MLRYIETNLHLPKGAEWTIRGTGRIISIHVAELVDSGKRDETELRERHTITSELTIPHDFSFTSFRSRVRQSFYHVRSHCGNSYSTYNGTGASIMNMTA